MSLLRTFVLLCLCQQLIVAGFKQVNDISYAGLRTFLPQSGLTRISDLDLNHIEAELLPSYWSKSIPFFAGISHDRRKAFYFQYELLGFSKINYIQLDHSLIRDVAVTSSGDILLASESGLHHYRYHFQSETLEEIAFHSIKGAYALDLNDRHRLIVLSDDGVSVYTLKDDKLRRKSFLSKKLNNLLSDERPIAASICPRGNLAILSDASIYFFNIYGRLNEQLQNKQNYRLIDVTAESDFILASPFTNKLDKYSTNGSFLFSQKMKGLKKPLVNFSIYKRYGNVAVFDDEKGLYMTMKTGLSIDDAKYNDGRINARFRLHFPSDVKISLLNKNKKKEIEVLSKALASDHYELSWSELPNFKVAYIQIEAIGLYSESNKVQQLEAIRY